jgi:autonomous glycyl radical cofactor GrcA
MFYDKEKEEYYCLRCPFTGTEEEVLKLNELAKFRYKNILVRITEFD